jgi:hypothetical protein
MSSLLEKAIVDATALKEAALKNAENLVIEKYSQEIKDAMTALLEQEGDELDLTSGLSGDEMMPDLSGGAPTDPMADPMGDPMGDPMAGGPEIADDQSPEEDLAADSLQASLGDAFHGNADEDEVIRIRLDALEAEFADEDRVFGGDDVLDDDEVSIDITDLEATHGAEPSVPDATVAPALPATPATPAAPSADMSAGITQAALQEVLDEMNIEEDIDVDELLETLRVDFEPQKSGWAGTPESIMREYEQMLLAREQDDEVKEENEALRKTVSKLQKENKIIGSAGLKLQKENKKFRATFDTLQEKLEQVNVSNAKLLYINQTLENASLNERQKRKVVEAISKAGSVNEAKVVYDTLQDAVGSAEYKGKNAPSSLSEAVTRRSSLIMAARQEQKINDANPFFDRMQRLAGIKT